MPALLCMLATGALLGLAGCGGGGDGRSAGSLDDSSTAARYSIGGTLSGLAAGAQVTLLNNGDNPLTLTQNGAFTFPGWVSSGSSYAVSVLIQPTAQICSPMAQSAWGVAGDANVWSINITCSGNAYTIGGILSGLKPGGKLTLQNNGGDALNLDANAPFTFATPVAANGSYSVVVTSQPAGQTCSPSGQSAQGSGITADVTNVGVVCSADAYSVGGTLTGLAPGAVVVLQNNGSDSLTLTANGRFTFAAPVASGGGYSVLVLKQPDGQTCAAANQSAQGAAVGAPVTSVNISCSGNAYTVGGTLRGLAAGSQVTLQNNGGDVLTLTGNGPYTFAMPVPYGGGYAISVASQPAGQNCMVVQASGSNMAAPVSSADVTCLSPAMATLTLAGTSASMASTLSANVTLSNSNDSWLPAVNLGLALPPGFTATPASPNACGGSLVTSKAQLTLTGAQLSAKGTCTIGLTLNIPTLALPSAYPAAFGWNGMSGATGATPLPTLTFSANTPTATPSGLGVTPGADTYYWLPTSTTPAYVFTVKVNTDPGPASDVYWAFQMFALNGYVGLQSTTLSPNGAATSGKQFLFSLWGENIQAAPGALPGQPASTCNVSATAADGSPGGGCRVLYDWQVGHTYQFTVTAMGNYQYKTNVSDITAGLSNPVSFDIGTLTQPSSANANAIPRMPNGGSDIVQFLEYFDWNDHRTTCLSVPYTDATLAASYLNSSGMTSGMPPQPGDGGSGACASQSTINNLVLEQIAGIGQTSQGLIKGGVAGCMTARSGLSDGNPAGSNSALLATCPKATDVQNYGGTNYRNYLWVYAQDHSIQGYANYCLTSTGSASSGTQATVQSCIPGALNQQWIASGTAGTQKLQSALSGLCLLPQSGSSVMSNNTLSLGDCNSANAAVWQLPGISFSY